MYERFEACFDARDWAAMAGMLADDIYSEDRRRVVNAELRQGRDALIENLRAATELGVTNAISDVDCDPCGAPRPHPFPILAQRRANPARSSSISSCSRDRRPTSGSRPLLRSTSTTSMPRSRSSTPDTSPAKPPPTRTRGRSSRPPYAAMRPARDRATTPDWVNIDRRRLAVETGDLAAYIRAMWDATDDVSVLHQAVHRLSNVGAVVTHASRAISQEGFDAEWRDVNLLTVDGDLINRIELFDESDIDAALATF